MTTSRRDDPHGGQHIVRTGADIDQASAVVIAIHGRGASADDILSLSQFVDREDVAWMAPQAAMNTWYPHSFLAPLARNEPWLSSALRLIGSLVEEAERHVPTSSIVIVGFSQGACLASEFVARHARRYGGLVAFSGGLIGSADGDGAPPHDKQFRYDGSLDATPVFIGCSDIDPHIPVERVHDTARVLEGLGAAVTKEIYAGMPHTIIDDEIHHFQKMMDTV